MSYVIDIDSTVKLIYGHQEGVETGYNTVKPGRPSHNYHTAFVETVRIALTIDVKGGKRLSGTCGLPALSEFADRLPA